VLVKAALKHLNAILLPRKEFLTASNRVGVTHMLRQAEQVDYTWRGIKEAERGSMTAKFYMPNLKLAVIGA